MVNTSTDYIIVPCDYEQLLFSGYEAQLQAVQRAASQAGEAQLDKHEKVACLLCRVES